MSERRKETIPPPDARELALLVEPLTTQEIPTGEIENQLRIVSLLGAVSRLGLQIESRGEDYDVALTNPFVEDSERIEVTVSGMTIRDVTPEAVTELLKKNASLPSPFGIELSEPPVRVFTSDSQTPEEGVLVVDSFFGDFGGRFKATLTQGEVSAFEVIKYAGPITKILRVTYKQGKPQEFQLFQYVESYDANSRIFEKSRQVVETIKSLKRLTSLNAPRGLLADSTLIIQERLVNLINLVNSRFEAEEVKKLIMNLGNLSPEDVLREVFGRSKYPHLLRQILYMLKEDIPPQSKTHGYYARLVSIGEALALRDVGGLGQTTRLLPQWHQNVSNLARDEHVVVLWLTCLNEWKDMLLDDFENFAALLRGKITFSELGEP